MEPLTAPKRLANLGLAGICLADVILYTYCGELCTYVEASLLGLPLEYLGIAYALALIVLNLFRRDVRLLALLSIGVGAEIFLVGYQVYHEVSCPYCLVFAILVLFQFILNVRRERTGLTAACIIAGFLVFFILFEGAGTAGYELGHVRQHLASRQPYSRESRCR